MKTAKRTCLSSQKLPSPLRCARLAILLGATLCWAHNMTAQSVVSGSIALGTVGENTTLPTVAVGAASTLTVQFQLLTTSAISGITISKAANGVQEFTLGAVTGCTVGGGSIAAGTICSAAITFNPAFPGLRTATLSVAGASSPIGTLGLNGMGTGPEVVQSPGALSVIAGGGTALLGTTSTAANTLLLNNPTGIAMDGAGNLYVVVGDAGNATILKITGGQAVVIAGGGSAIPGGTPIAATSAHIHPFGIAVDTAGNLYIADYGNNLVEKMDATTQQLVVVAGGGGDSPSTTADGATNVGIYPFGVAVDRKGNLYVADFNNSLVEEVAAGSNQIVVVAGGGYVEASAVPELATAAGFYQVLGVAVDYAGNLYIADAGDDVIEKVTVADGMIIRIAGFGPNFPSTIPTVAVNAGLNTPSSVTVDPAGNVYLADTSNGQIEQVNSAGQIIVVAGSGATNAGAAAQSATSVKLYNPTGVVADGAGNLYITDANDNLIDKVTPAALALSFPSTNVGATSGTQQTVNIENVGNASANLTSLTMSTDFPLLSASGCTVSKGLQALPNGAACSLVYGFLPTAGGARSQTATLSDNTLNVASSQTISFTGTGVAAITPPNPGSYTVTANPTSMNVQAGQAGTSIITLTPTGGYAGSVSLSCSNLPENSTCAFTPSGGTAGGSATLANNQPTSVTLVVQTNVSGSAALRLMPVFPAPLLPVMAVFGPGSLLGLLLLRRRNRMRGRLTLLSCCFWCFAAASAIGISGCTSGGGGASPLTTPPGSTNVVITAAAASGTTGLTEFTTLKVNVTQ
jgi:sugar lactone lactonase YvrE